MPFRPLDGLRVLDLTRLLPGPFLSQLFADLGADVVKVEASGAGDYARWIPPEVDGVGHVFAAVNRGKRSIAVDLKTPEGAEVVKRLAAMSDVFLESFRPGVLDRWGLSDETLAQANPRLVRASLVGYGPGPLRDAPGHDINYQSMAGILDVQGTAEQPMVGATQTADVAGGLYAAVGVLAALRERDRTGQGRRVEVALADAALSFNVLNLARVMADDELPPRGAWPLSGGIPGYRLYECADGAWVALGALEPKFWQRFVGAAGEPDLDDLHVDASPEAHARVARTFAARPAADWLAHLQKAGVPVTPVLDPREALEQAARFHGRPSAGSPLTGEGSRAPVPKLGADADAVLREAGYDAAEIARLREARVLGEPS